MSDVLLTDYFPTPDNLDPASILDARSRLAIYLAAWFPEIDTRPNSVFGDLHLTPMAILMAALEEAMRRRDSDLNLGNVANGLVYNSSFVLSYLQNFGVTPSSGVPATGVIKLSFSASAPYTINQSAQFTFGTSVFTLALPSSAGSITIYPTGTAGAQYVLTREQDSVFSILLPVTGPAGSIVSDGSPAVTSLTQSQLIGVTAAGVFDSGIAAPTISGMARQAQAGYPARSLNSRSGVLSFLQANFPQLLGTSVVLTGDAEMVRDGSNILGVAEGVVDIFARSQATFAVGSITPRLVYNGIAGGWNGALIFPVVPLFFSLSSGIFQVTNFQNSQGQSTIYSKSLLPSADNVGIAYSKNELLGVLITNGQPDDLTQASLSQISQVSGTENATLEVTGQYVGSAFSTITGRQITLRFDSVTTINGFPAAVASVRDSSSSDYGLVYFVGNAISSPALGSIQKDAVYTLMLSGLELSIIPQSGVFNPASLVGNTYTFNFQGESADFTCEFLYDPIMISIDAVVNDPQNKPAGVSIMARSFIICLITTFTINYRAAVGASVDLATAQQQIFDYLHGIIYPDVYEISRIGQIMLSAGASGMQSVVQRGVFYPSLASQFIHADGDIDLLPQAVTATLLPDPNDLGYGPRNIAYLIDVNTIKFNVIGS